MSVYAIQLHKTFFYNSEIFCKQISSVRGGEMSKTERERITTASVPPKRS